MSRYFQFRVNREKFPDVIDKLESVPNLSEYIRDLVSADILMGVFLDANDYRNMVNNDWSEYNEEE